jgi:hypothetical protein
VRWRAASTDAGSDGSAGENASQASDCRKIASGRCARIRAEPRTAHSAAFASAATNARSLVPR